MGGKASTVLTERAVTSPTSVQIHDRKDSDEEFASKPVKAIQFTRPKFMDPN
jgi:hypothetical protein